jgi:hypothetical protein
LRNEEIESNGVGGTSSRQTRGPTFNEPALGSYKPVCGFHRTGWGRMQILPYIASSDCYWRCELHPTGKPNLPFYWYSGSSDYRFLENHCGGAVRKNISAEALANAISRVWLRR